MRLASLGLTDGKKWGDQWTEILKSSRLVQDFSNKETGFQEIPQNSIRAWYIIIKNILLFLSSLLSPRAMGEQDISTRGMLIQWALDVRSAGERFDAFLRDLPQLVRNLWSRRRVGLLACIMRRFLQGKYFVWWRRLWGGNASGGWFCYDWSLRVLISISPWPWYDLDLDGLSNLYKHLLAARCVSLCDFGTEQLSKQGSPICCQSSTRAFLEVDSIRISLTRQLSQILNLCLSSW